MTIARNLCLIGVLATYSVAASAIDVTAGIDQETTEYSAVERGFAEPGSALHEWMKSQAQGVSDEIGFRYEIESQSLFDSKRSLVEALTVPSTRSKTIELDGDPGPPAGTPNGIPSTATTNDSCAGLGIDGNPATGNATFTWTYQNTRDSNGDGKKDSDPKWVLTGFSVTNIELLSANGAIGC